MSLIGCVSGRMGLGASGDMQGRSCGTSCLGVLASKAKQGDVPRGQAPSRTAATSFRPKELSLPVGPAFRADEGSKVFWVSLNSCHEVSGLLLLSCSELKEIIDWSVNFS